jgi:hypothetical protein
VPDDLPIPAAPAYCGRCGDPLDGRDHAACARLLDLEPPRYCPACRRRMVVQVTPDAWTARCVEHGELSDGTGARTGP